MSPFASTRMGPGCLETADIWTILPKRRSLSCVRPAWEIPQTSPSTQMIKDAEKEVLSPTKRAEIPRKKMAPMRKSRFTADGPKPCRANRAPITKKLMNFPIIGLYNANSLRRSKDIACQPDYRYLPASSKKADARLRNF